jgi:outer membrane protein
LLSAAAVLGLAFAASAQQTTPPKVGIISMQGALAGTKDGQKALQELDAKFAPKKKEFDTRQNEVAQLQDQYNKGGTVMNDEKRNQLARDIDEKKKRLQRDMQDAEEELQSEQQRLVQSLAQRLMAVVEKYAKDNGYSMILDDSSPSTPVLWASSGIDITHDIIALYDQTSSNGGPASAPVTPGSPTTRTPGAVTPGTTAPRAPSTSPGPAASAKPSAASPR